MTASTSTEAAVTAKDSLADVVSGTGLKMRYGEGPTAVDALRGVDISFERGTFSAIMGPSGSGKSTLLHILAGLERPTGGSCEIAGISLNDLSDRELTLLASPPRSASSSRATTCYPS